MDQDKKNNNNINFENRKRTGIVYEKSEMGEFISEEAKERKRNIRTVSSGESYQQQQAEKANKGRGFRKKAKPVKPINKPAKAKKTPKKEKPEPKKVREPKPVRQAKPVKPVRQTNGGSGGSFKKIGKWIALLLVAGLLVAAIAIGGKKFIDYRMSREATKAEKQKKADEEKAKNVKQNQWIEADGKRYYYGEDGMPTIGRFRLEDKIYYTNSRGAVEREIDGNKPMVALTFDDGPTDISEDLLEVLDEYDAQATFFEIGNRIADQDAIEKQILKQHCQIANHTFTNKLSKDDADQIANEIEKADTRIKSFLPVKDEEEEPQAHVLEDNPMFVRTPDGVLSETILNTVEHPIILWTVDTLDWKTKDVKKIYYSATTDIEDGDIIMLTALKKPTVRALEQIIPELESQGFQLVNVQDLVEFRGGAQAGKAYTAFPPEGGKTTKVTPESNATEATTAATTAAVTNENQESVTDQNTDNEQQQVTTPTTARRTKTTTAATTAKKKPATTAKKKPATTEKESVEPTPPATTEAPSKPEDSQVDGES
ncbi:MAG: polysaccharide deacetylase family protein [Lachnospiraceae bacterium]|nr:polysaccharide deacetylase family protein [Lachnospiraceae bacterium]